MEILVHADDFAVVDLPVGGAEPAALAAALAGVFGTSRGGPHPFGGIDPEVGGVQLVARTVEAGERLAAQFGSGDATLEFCAITPAPLWEDGCFTQAFEGRPAETRFETVATRGAWSELSLVAASGDAQQIRFHLADAGLAIAGDASRGGARVSGGLRLRRARLRMPSEGVDVRTPEPPDFWPPEPVFPADDPRPTLVVSRATALALRRGHPWILTDAETSDVRAYRPGTLVDVRSVRGEPSGVARIEGPGRIAARVWAKESRRDRMASVEARVARALAKRRELIEAPESDALRLVHGEADGLPGLAVDRLGPLLRALVTSRVAEPIVDRVLNALIGQLAGVLGPNPPVVRVVHLADPPAGHLHAVAVVRGSLDGICGEDGRLRVREGGLVFLIDPGVGDPYRPRPGTGLFLDQRENRARIARAAAGGRWLNLFCHTGGFSVAALAGDAREVVSVDLSAPYLRWLEANLAENALAHDRHHSVRMDARRYLERLGESEVFDGIVFDPPTAAGAGRRFWSVRREGGAMIDACLRRLRPGGMLLACRNDRGSRGALGPLVESVAEAAGIPLAGVEAAAAGPDFPGFAAFPEGDPFEGVIVTRA